jgi:hypothetical protein
VRGGRQGRLRGTADDRGHRRDLLAIVDYRRACSSSPTDSAENGLRAMAGGSSPRRDRRDRLRRWWLGFGRGGSVSGAGGSASGVSGSASGLNPRRARTFVPQMDAGSVAHRWGRWLKGVPVVPVGRALGCSSAPARLHRRRRQAPPWRSSRLRMERRLDARQHRVGSCDPDASSRQLGAADVASNDIIAGTYDAMLHSQQAQPGLANRSSSTEA